MSVKPQKPGPGPESVCDYPRPPRLERSDERVVIEFGGRTIAESSSVIRVLETSHPPVYYVPTADFESGALIPVSGTSWCEFKGEAHYYDVVSGTSRAERAGWGYPSPTAGFESLLDTVAVYPGLMGRCLVDGETVKAQSGGFYGGWITSRVVGPFKGEPGSWGW